MLEHHILWIDRKFKHAEKSRYNARFTRQQDEANAMIYVELLKSENKAAMNSAINHLLPPYEKALERAERGEVVTNSNSEEFVDPLIAFKKVLEARQQGQPSENDE